jgi:hypothetical protein
MRKPEFDYTVLLAEEFVVADIDKFLSRAKFLWRLLMMNIDDSRTKQKAVGYVSNNQFSRRNHPGYAKYGTSN